MLTADYVSSFITSVIATGNFYNATTTIKTSRGSPNHAPTYTIDWATMGKTTPSDVSAAVEKLNGNKNNLTVTITEFCAAFSINKIKATFSINNHTANTYKIGNYNVYVDTKNNDQIRVCYITA